MVENPLAFEFSKTRTICDAFDEAWAFLQGLGRDLTQAPKSLATQERIEREMVRYRNLTQMASFTAKIIFDAISQWHPASNQQNASETTTASTKDDIGEFGKSHHRSQWDTSELGQEADATEGTPTHAKV